MNILFVLIIVLIILCLWLGKNKLDLEERMHESFLIEKRLRDSLKEIQAEKLKNSKGNSKGKSIIYNFPGVSAYGMANLFGGSAKVREMVSKGKIQIKE